MFVRVASQALGQSYHCPSASELTLKNMGDWQVATWNKLQTCVQISQDVPLMQPIKGI